MQLVMQDPAALAPGVVVGAPVRTESTHWRHRVRGTVVASESTETTSGWPLTLVRTCEPNQLSAFFELFEHGAVVVVSETVDGALARALDRVRSYLRSIDIDRRPTDVVALAQLWED